MGQALNRHEFVTNNDGIIYKYNCNRDDWKQCCRLPGDMRGEYRITVSDDGSKVYLLSYDHCDLSIVDMETNKMTTLPSVLTLHSDVVYAKV